ncbi:MAG: VOC family protein [Planctomycetes bacterium]|nr:VOC family protein [Planctomycetota bacterium]
MAGKIAWFEIPTADFARAQKFYEGIFETKLRVLQVGPDFQMAAFTDGAQMHGALIKQATYEPSHKGTMVYFDAGPDLNAVLNRVEKFGGKILRAKLQISPEYGYMGLFEDSEGNRVALHSMA